MKKKTKGVIFAIIGYILSPVSWWNDLYVNIPIAYIFALPFGYLSKQLFFPALIIAYWISNIVGFMMMHHGVKKIISKDINKRKEFVKLFFVSLIYTVFVVLIILIGWLKFPTDYLN